MIFAKTSEVFPETLVNTIEGRSAVPPQRFAELSMTFDTPFAFTVNAAAHGQAHGQGLFFDTSLKMLNTGEDVHRGGVRLLSIPVSNWAWPEEGVRINRVYPRVT